MKKKTVLRLLAAVMAATLVVTGVPSTALTGIGTETVFAATKEETPAALTSADVEKTADTITIKNASSYYEYVVVAASVVDKNNLGSTSDLSTYGTTVTNGVATGLEPNTLYYVYQRKLGSTGSSVTTTDSDWSESLSVTTNQINFDTESRIVVQNIDNLLAAENITLDYNEGKEIKLPDSVLAKLVYYNKYTANDTYKDDGETKKGTDGYDEGLDTYLVAGTDYTVKYADNTKRGTATVTITAIGSKYTGSRTATFTIGKRDLTKAVDISNNSLVKIKVEGYEYKLNSGSSLVNSSIYKATYTGQPITPSVEVSITLSDGTDKELVEGEDYRVVYSNNTYVSDASGKNSHDSTTPTVEIQGIGNYIGILEAHFTIEKNTSVSTPTAPKVTSVTDKSVKIDTKDNNETGYNYVYQLIETTNEADLLADNWKSEDGIAALELKAGHQYYVFRKICESAANYSTSHADTDDCYTDSAVSTYCSFKTSGEDLSNNTTVTVYLTDKSGAEYDKTVEYNGKAQTPEYVVKYEKNGKMIVISKENYTLSFYNEKTKTYGDTTNTGRIYAVVEFTGDYSGKIVFDGTSSKNKEASYKITPKDVVARVKSAESRPYNAKTNVTLEVVANQADGVVAGETLSFSEVQGSLADKNVATGIKVVSVDSAKVAGNEKGNYSITYDTKNVNADITKVDNVEVSITKAYQGADSATLAIKYNETIAAGNYLTVSIGEEGTKTYALVTDKNGTAYAGKLYSVDEKTGALTFGDNTDADKAYTTENAPMLQVTLKGLSTNGNNYNCDTTEKVFYFSIAPTTSLPTISFGAAKDGTVTVATEDLISYYDQKTKTTDDDKNGGNGTSKTLAANVEEILKIAVGSPIDSVQSKTVVKDITAQQTKSVEVSDDEATGDKYLTFKYYKGTVIDEQYRLADAPIVKGTYTIVVTTASTKGFDSATASVTLVIGKTNTTELAATGAPTITGETSFTDSTTVTITAEDGALIYYTTDGSAPTNASTLYKGAFTLSETAKVQAIAIKSGKSASTVATKTFTKKTADEIKDEANNNNTENGNSTPDDGYKFVENTTDKTNSVVDANGELVTSQKITVGTKDYITDANGVVITNTITTTPAGNEVYVDKDGAIVKGKVITYNGAKYYANKNGKIVKNGFYTTVLGNKVYAYADGKLAVGKVFTVKGYKYYANTKGRVITKVGFTTTKAGNTVYVANKKGQLKVNKTFKVNGKKYVANKKGVVKKVTK